MIYTACRTLLIFSLMFNLVFLSYLKLALAKPHRSAPPYPTSAEETPNEADPSKLESIIIAEPPAAQPSLESRNYRLSKADYYHSAAQAITPRLGVIYGIEDDSDSDKALDILLGFNYLLPKPRGTRWEVGVDLTTMDRGHFHIYRRKIYNEKGAFRPYYKYGLTTKLIGSEKLGTFVNKDNYILGAGIGFEDIVRIPRSIRLELEALVGQKDILIVFTYGYSFSW